MEGYFKKFFIGHFLILMIAAVTGFYFNISSVTIISFVLLLALLIYVLDVKYLPKRKTEIAGKLIEIFNAEPFSEKVMKFKIVTFDLYAEIEADFLTGIAQVANFETVKFHIPKNQIDHLPIKPGPELKDDKINESQTYNVYQTDGKGLNSAKDSLEKMIKNIKATARG